MFVLGVLLLGLCAAPARASSGRAGRDDRAAVAQAKQRFLRGAEHFRLGRFAQAREDFAASYLLSGRVALLYNLALAEERLGNIPAAIENLERYVAAPDIEDRAAVQLHLEELRRRQPPIAATATPEGTQLQRLRLAKWLSLGTGLAAVVAGGVLLGVDGRQDCGTAPVQCPTVLDTRVAGATVLTGGLLLLGSAAVLWALERRQGKAPKASLALRLASGRF